MKKTGILICVFLLAAVAWTWRFCYVNEKYQDNTVVEQVPAGQWADLTMAGQGYSIRVDGMEILEKTQAIQTYMLTEEEGRYLGDKVAIVSVTLRNHSDAQNSIYPYSIKLICLDNYAALSDAMMRCLYPELDEDFAVTLPEGSEMSFVLAYDMNKEFFGAYTWRNLARRQWYLNGWFEDRYINAEV